MGASRATGPPKQEGEPARGHRGQASHSPSTVLATLFVLACLVFGFFASRHPAPAARPPVVVTVAAGDTIWDLATAHGPPGVDVRSTVDAIVAVNDLRHAAINPGDRIVIP